MPPQQRRCLSALCFTRNRTRTIPTFSIYNRHISRTNYAFKPTEIIQGCGIGGDDGGIIGDGGDQACWVAETIWIAAAGDYAGLVAVESQSPVREKTPGRKIRP
jgi:hypothetical protein